MHACHRRAQFQSIASATRFKPATKRQLRAEGRNSTSDRGGLGNVLPIYASMATAAFRSNCTPVFNESRSQQGLKLGLLPPLDLPNF